LKGTDKLKQYQKKAQAAISIKKYIKMIPESRKPVNSKGARPGIQNIRGIFLKI
jgi:hypothetical protein